MNSDTELKSEIKPEAEAEEKNRQGSEPMQDDTDCGQQRKQGIRMCIAVILAVVIIFAVISAAAEFLGAVLGKAAEIGVLVVIAVILAAILVKDKKKK